MSPSSTDARIVGRGKREGGRLFREWYDELGGAPDRGEQSAYVFVMGSLVELLRTFDLHVVFPEINSLQTAVRGVADGYLREAEDRGYSPDVCGYVKADYGVQVRDGEHPMGRIPPPDVAVFTNACNTYIKWAEVWERMYDIPTLTVDVPGSRGMEGGRPRPAENPDADRAYVLHQLRDVVEALEEITGEPYRPDRLRRALLHTNAMARSWRRVLELNRKRPAGFDAVMEGTIYLGVANALRGTEAGARYFRELVEEMEHRVEGGVGPLGGSVEEEHRLVFVGVPCYPIFRGFYELFSEWGGVFVTSTYTWFASGGLHAGTGYDVEHPLEGLADGLVRGVRRATDAMFFHDVELLRAIDDFGADGVVYHPVKSCRTVSTGLADSRRAVLEARDVLCLYIESDMMDQRVVSEAQLRNRIDAFFEGLESRKARHGAGGSAPASPAPGRSG